MAPPALSSAACRATTHCRRRGRPRRRPGTELRRSCRWRCPHRWREVMDRVRRERDRFVGLVLHDMQDIPDTERIRGHACFVNDHTIAVADHTSSPARASSSRRARAPPTRIGSVPWRALDPQRQRVRLARPAQSGGRDGSRIIGLELGQALHRLGVHVAVLGRAAWSAHRRSGDPRLRHRDLQRGIHTGARRAHCRHAA